MGVSWVETMVVKWVGLMDDCWAARTVAKRAGSRAVQMDGSRAASLVEKTAGSTAVSWDEQTAESWVVLTAG